jgi:hypothetical protein
LPKSNKEIVFLLAATQPRRLSLASYAIDDEAALRGVCARIDADGGRAATARIIRRMK